MQGLVDHPGTRTHASVAGWSYPATFTELALVDHAEWYMNVHRDRKALPNPIVLPRPWTSQSKSDVTPEERARLKQLLIASSPFEH